MFPLLVQVLLVLVGPTLASKRSAYYPVYSIPTPYVLSDPSYYHVPSSPSYFSNYPIYNAPPFNPIPPMTAVVDIKNYGGDEVSGRIVLTQLPGGPVLLMGNVTGLTAGAHGMHIHEFGDLAKGCDSLGEHYNPSLTHHGGPADPYRHVGDLGNINADSDGKAKIADSDHLISLTGPHSVVGRGLVIHSGKDDFGRGGDKESLRTGNSGTRIACGVIVWSLPAHLEGRPGPGQPPMPTESEAEQIEP